VCHLLYKNKKPGEGNPCLDKKWKSLYIKYNILIFLGHVAKLFTSIVNKRILVWSENCIVNDTQCGFKPGLGTRDAIFVLQSLITKSLQSNKRLYYVFVDFRKAFVSVTYDQL